MLLGDIGNRLDISDNEQRIAQIQRDQRSKYSAKSSKDKSQDEAIAALQADVSQLELALGTMATLLISKGVVTTDELGRLVEVIESGDGEAS